MLDFAMGTKAFDKVPEFVLRFRPGKQHYFLGCVGFFVKYNLIKTLNFVSQSNPRPRSTSSSSKMTSTKKAEPNGRPCG